MTDPKPNLAVLHLIVFLFNTAVMVAGVIFLINGVSGSGSSQLIAGAILVGSSIVAAELKVQNARLQT
jgi:hypothetical protein